MMGLWLCLAVQNLPKTYTILGVDENEQGSMLMALLSGLRSKDSSLEDLLVSYKRSDSKTQV